MPALMLTAPAGAIGLAALTADHRQAGVHPASGRPGRNGAGRRTAPRPALAGLHALMFAVAWITFRLTKAKSP